MTQIQYSKRNNPNLTTQVFDQDHKTTYFHDQNGTPDFMNTEQFNEEYEQDPSVLRIQL